MSPVKLICKAMERIAPLRLAGSWDNVGLLLESPIQRQNASRILLAIDLTPAVVQEALSTPTACIISYHPPIFSPLRSLTLSNPLQASLLRCAAAGVSVYTPHTALDAVWDGVNDWLARGLFAPGEEAQAEVTVLAKPVEELGGEGRVCRLPGKVAVEVLVGRIKKHLGLDQVQVAYSSIEGKERKVQSIGICAGSGGSVLRGADVDVYFTGEMTHHEVLAALAAGKDVILCGHTNTERGYLPVLASKLKQALDEDSALAQPQVGSLEVCVSEADRHPLQFV